MPEPLSTYTIYRKPADAPEAFVVRRWEIQPLGPQAREAFTAPTLDAARELIPGHCVQMARAPDDDPAIVETWI